MATTDEQNVRLVAHMLAEEVEYWSTNTRLRMEDGGVAITWEIFKEEFLGKYFLEDVRSKGACLLQIYRKFKLTFAENGRYTMALSFPNL